MADAATDILVIVISVAGGLLTDALIALVFARRQGRARKSRRSGNAVLEYGWVLKAFPFPISAFFAYITLHIATSGIVRTEADTWYAVLFVAIWAAPIAVFVAEVFGVSFELDDRGIQKRSPWSRGFYASWDEVRSVRYDHRWERYIVDTAKGRMRLSVLLNGLEDFRAYVQDRLPPAVVT